MAALLIAPLCATSFGQVWPTNELAVTTEATRSIPYVNEFLTLYPDATVQMCYPASVISTPETQKEVNETYYLCTRVGLHTRYVLTMNIRFWMTPDQKAITRLKEPNFQMQDFVITVTPIPGLPGGQAHIMHGPFEAGFGYDKFKVLKEHNGDFSAIGLTIRKDVPVENFDRVWKPNK